MTSTTKVILGIVGAAAAGVVIGLLIAPEKGSDLRGRLSRTAGDWAGHVGDIFRNSQQEAEDLKDKTMSTAKKVRTNVENSMG